MWRAAVWCGVVGLVRIGSFRVPRPLRARDTPASELQPYLLNAILGRLNATQCGSMPRNSACPARYVFLGANSTFKADSDLAKYEKARKLKDLIGDVRRNYERDWDSSDRRKQQMVRPGMDSTYRMGFVLCTACYKIQRSRRCVSARGRA